VGLISYFLHVNRMLESPKIIEMRVFEEARATAFQDELTGLRNYRFFVTYLSQEVRCSRQYNTPLSLVMIDVDYFKVYNDNNGHERGNEALMTIAGLLEKTLRGCDIAARYGGEEFVLLLPSTPKVGAQVVAERARRAIEEHVFPSGNSQPEGRLTASMGVATCPGDADKPEDLIRRADRAMYLAKADGRNQVRLYDGSHRSYRRVPAVLNGSFFRITGKPRPLTTVNISERGLSLLTDHEIAVGSLLEISLSLPDSHQQIVLNGKVVQGESTAKGQYRAGVHILEIGAQDRVRLVRYLREPGGWAAG
jgi:diguanylate cyclase (GGDEF)-like protein